MNLITTEISIDTKKVIKDIIKIPTAGCIKNGVIEKPNTPPFKISITSK